MIDTAKNYIFEGLGALPLKADKSPKLPVGHNYLYELIKEQSIESMFLGAEKIGVACGYVSGNFEAMDFDAHKGEPIRDIFNNFMKDTGVSTIVELHNLPIIKTPSGGYHIYYKCEAVDSGKTLAKWEDNTVMIETRGHGQYVATVPSKDYTQIRGCEIINTPEISQDERDFLFIAAESFSKGEIKTTASNSNGGKWPDKFDTTTAWGMFNEKGEDEIKELLTGIGWEFIRNRNIDNVEMWRRPGKEKGISATIGKYHNMFYSFTDSMDYFEKEKGYSFFDLLMILKFDGDKVATIKYLEKKYNIVHYKPQVTKKTIDFPIDVFPEKIKQYILEQNKQSNHDINLMCSMMLWTFSVLIGNKFTTFVHDGWNVSPVMWLMIIAERGSNKTHAINAVVAPLTKIDNENRKAFNNEIKAHDPESKEVRPIWKQLLLEDGTREGFIKALNHNPGGMGLLKDELSGWLADMDKHSSSKGGDESFWLSSYNNSSYKKNIKSEDASHVERIFLSLAGSIQPSVMNNIMSNHVENGLLDRCLLVQYEDKSFTFSLKKPEISYYKFYNDFINSVYRDINRFIDVLNFDFAEDAKEVFEECYNSFLKVKHSSDNHKISAYMAKIITMLPRISLIIETIDQFYANFGKEFKEPIDQTVQKSSILKSYDILQYFINNAKNTMFEVDERNDMADIIKAAKAIKKGDKAIALLEALDRKEISATKISIAAFIGMTKQNIQYYSDKINRKSKKSKN